MSNRFLELVNGKSWQSFRDADGQEFYRMIGESTCYTGEELLARIKSALLPVDVETDVKYRAGSVNEFGVPITPVDMTEQQWRDACENASADKWPEVEATLRSLGLIDDSNLSGWYREVLRRGNPTGETGTNP